MTDIVTIDVIDLWKQITERDLDSDTLSIIDQILRTERLLPEISQGGSNSQNIHSIQVPLLENSFRLDIKDDETLQRILDEPRAYQYLLYLHLLKINNMFADDGWFPIRTKIDGDRVDMVNPRIITHRQSYRDLVDSTLENSNAILNDLLELEVPNFDLRVIYADRINKVLLENPFWNNIHQYMFNTFRHPDLVFYNYPDVKMIDLIQDGPRITSASNYPIEFYENLEDVPLPDILLELKNIEGGGYGTTFLATFASRIPMFAKYNTRTDLMTTHEFLIGIELNRFYSQVPFFMYTYGLTRLHMNRRLLWDQGVVIDNHSDYSTGGRDEVPTTMMLAQWVPNAVTLREYMAEFLGATEWNDDKTMRLPVSLGESLRRILSAIMITSRYLWEQLEFVHGDLHEDNILIARFDEPQIIELPYGGCYNLNVVPVIIDYGFSSIRKPMVSNTALIPYGSRAVMNPYDADLVNQDALYVFDIEPIIRRTLTRAGRLMRQDSDSDILLQQLGELHYHLITGQELSSIDPMVSETVNDHVEELLHNADDLETIYYRMLPLGLSTYSPDEAIMRFYEHSDTCVVPIPESPNINIDYLIDDGEPIEITTYSGAVLYRENVTELGTNATILPETYITLNNNRQNLNDLYSKASHAIGSLSVYNEADRDEVRRRLAEANLQYIYRYQINRKIRAILP